jgi:plastocyanin
MYGSPRPRSKPFISGPLNNDPIVDVMHCNRPEHRLRRRFRQPTTQSMTIVRRRMFAAALLSVGLLAGCGGDGGTDPPGAVTTLDLTPTSPDTLFSFGDTLFLVAVAKDANGAVVNGAPVSYASSAQDVASVSSEGEVVAKANGSTTITATSGTVNATVTARVRQKFAQVRVAPDSRRLAVGASATLTATPMDARGNVMTGMSAAAFQSDNNGIATVTAGGVVTAVGNGMAHVAARITSPVDGQREGFSHIDVVTAEASATVTMGAVTFTPQIVDITRGGTVTFANPSGVAHDVDFGVSGLNIPVHSSGQNTRTFANSGTFQYHCNLHSGMTGTVFVH